MTIDGLWRIDNIYRAPLSKQLGSVTLVPAAARLVLTAAAALAVLHKVVHKGTQRASARPAIGTKSTPALRMIDSTATDSHHDTTPTRMTRSGLCSTVSGGSSLGQAQIAVHIHNETVNVMLICMCHESWCFLS